ncbi:uncharacterized protein FIBRA_00125 [Fibroporia radiculosa]|uniref:Uncharacterized protein n=1 Tax=Fibroporia radiculosa TaxID=599839 RepID=J7SBU4_9APHY|nr:uncharacterized protein FIBRA_00125 [Fibroporia radiculosa]CCL98131.1 predicted protein [Fibroporia radiculosa]
MYNLGLKRNINSVLGNRPLLWCWPTVPPGTGLKYQLAEGEDPDAEMWPPEDPAKAYTLPEPDPNYKFRLPDSPWTYQNGSLNPNLEPSNARQRSTSQRRRKVLQGPYSSLPPYHPDYNETQDEDAYSVSSESSGYEEYEDNSAFAHRIAEGVARVRRGSEGYEVKAIDRDAILQKFVEGRTHEPGRYQPYVPQPESDSEPEDIDDSVPLARKIE